MNRLLPILTLLCFGLCKESPLGTYLLISDSYEFEQILIFKENNKVIVFEKNYNKTKNEKSLELLEKYTVFWKVQDEKLCFPLEKIPSNTVDKNYCNDYYIDDNELTFFEPGLGNKVNKIKFIKISEKTNN